MTGESVDCPRYRFPPDNYETMEKAACSKFQFVKGAFHDTRSATNDRGYAGAQSVAAHASLLRTTGLALCTLLRQVTGSIRHRGDSCLPGLPDQRKEAGYKFDSHRRIRASLSLQSHTPQGLDVRRYHSGAQKAAE